jgi:demethylmenaquinone methyltransferase/2-methoxy-6-polyprenyl-1,4-benzoquinol methylase
MFSYLFMKILEARPRSYDRRMDDVSGGRVAEMKRGIAEEIPAGAHVLEIGCGTGELASMLIARGATVEGFDLSPSMITAAGERIEMERLGHRLTVTRMGVDGMDRFEGEAFDAVVSTLVFSELNRDERRFALKQSFRVLKAGGLLAIADEVVPRTWARRLLQSVIRVPLLLVVYLVSGSTTRPIADLAGEIRDAGFSVGKEVRSHGGAVALLTARKPDEERA